MDTVALHTRCKPGQGPAYEALHAAVPDAVAAALREAGVHDWRIWRDGDDVFHLVEVEDYRAMRDALRDLPANVAWQESVAPLFDVADDYGDADPVAAPVWSLRGQPSGDRG